MSFVMKYSKGLWRTEWTEVPSPYTSNTSFCIPKRCIKNLNACSIKYVDVIKWQRGLDHHSLDNLIKQGFWVSLHTSKT